MYSNNKGKSTLFELMDIFYRISYIEGFKGLHLLQTGIVTQIKYVWLFVYKPPEYRSILKS